MNKYSDKQDDLCMYVTFDDVNREVKFQFLRWKAGGEHPRNGYGEQKPFVYGVTCTGHVFKSAYEGPVFLAPHEAKLEGSYLTRSDLMAALKTITKINHALQNDVWTSIAGLSMIRMAKAMGAEFGIVKVQDNPHSSSYSDSKWEVINLDALANVVDATVSRWLKLAKEEVAREKAQAA